MGIVLLTLVVDPKASAEQRPAGPRCVGDRRPIRAEIRAHRRPVNVTVVHPRLVDLPSHLEEASIDRRRHFEDDAAVPSRARRETRCRQHHCMGVSADLRHRFDRANYVRGETRCRQGRHVEASAAPHLRLEEALVHNDDTRYHPQFARDPRDRTTVVHHHPVAEVPLTIK